MADILNGKTLDFDTETMELVILDQTLLPSEEKILRLSSPDEIFDAIKLLRVRGAPAIGVAASIAMAVCAWRIHSANVEEFIERIEKIRTYLASSRPTAVNLFWALDKAKKIIDSNRTSVDEIKKKLKDSAVSVLENDILTCKRIGENGFELIKDCKTILTHCNAGRLACVKYGTALSPIYIAKERGVDIKVYADETRPLLQGARLTAYELCSAGIENTVICDNMAASLMQKGLIDAVIVGADRIAANLDTANKIGTLSVAINAAYFGIPFYVAAPMSTFDFSCKSAEDIVIEQRDSSEISSLYYSRKMIPDGSSIYNPAFDVTPGKLITGVITEENVCVKMM